MNSLQLPPLGSVSNASPPSSGTGAGDPSSTTPPPAAQAPKPAPQTNQTTPAPQPASQVPIAARAGAAAAQAAEVAREQTPAFALDVGLIRGSFKVFVDVTDKDSHRFIARVYGPKGEVPPSAAPTATKRVVTEA
jgi:hypothetical protein